MAAINVTTASAATTAGAAAGRPFPSEIPFLHELGVEFLGMADGRAEVALELQPRHMNSWHVVHGGVVMTLLDVAMAMAGRSLEPAARGGVTIDMNTSFARPAGVCGERIVATGHAYHRSSTLCFCEGEVRNGDKLVARAMGTFKYRRATESKTSGPNATV